MSRPKKWDIYEAALLLDMLIQIENGIYTHDEGCKKLSAMLRRKALNEGDNIDNVYRNYAGMCLQMLKLSYAWDESKDTSKCCTKIFIEICELYKNNRTQYESILKNGISMVMPDGNDYKASIDVKGTREMDDKKMNGRWDAFLNWLSTQVSPTRLSDMYIALPEINIACIIGKDVKKTIFEIDDADTLNSIADKYGYTKAGNRHLPDKKWDIVRYYTTYLRLNNMPDKKTYEDKTLNTPLTATIGSITSLSNDYQDKYTAYLKKIGRSQPNIKMVLSVMQRVDKILKQEYGVESIFTLHKMEDVSTAYIWLLSNYQFLSLEKRISDIASKAIIQYICMLYDMQKGCSEGNSTGTINDLIDVAELFIIRQEKSGCSRDNVVKIMQKAQKYCRLSFEILGTNEETAIKEIRNVVWSPTFLALRTDNSTMKLRDKIRKTVNEYYSFVKSYNLLAQELSELMPEMKFQVKRIPLQEPEKIEERNPDKPEESTPDNSGIQDENAPKVNDHDSEGEIPEISEKKPNEHTLTKDKTDAILSSFEAWLIDSGRSEKLGTVYRQALMATERMLRLDNPSFSYFTSTPEKIRESWGNLKFDTDLSRGRISQFKCSIMYFADFCEEYPSLQYNGKEDRSGNGSHNTSGESKDTVKEPVGGERWKRVLEEVFPDGYIPSDFISQMQASMKWSELYNESCPLQGTDMDNAFLFYGTKRDDRIFVKSAETGELLDDICNEISGILSEFTGVYPSQIYAKYEAKLAEQSIYSLDVMVKSLEAHTHRNFELQYGIYVKPGETCYQSRDCRKILLERGGMVTTDELYQKLWFLSRDGVNAGINSCEDMIRVGVGKWMLAEQLPISGEDAVEIGNIIQRELEVKMIVRSTEIKQILEREVPNLATNLSAFDNMAIINLLRYYLKSRFDFSAAIISHKGQKVMIKDLFASFARERASFTVEELETIAKENGVSIYWQTTLENAVRISKTEFVGANNIDFDVDSIDQALESLCTGDYIGIKQLPDYMLTHLPSCGYTWNAFLLFSYLYSYSKRFAISYRSISKAGCYGAVVRRNSSLMEYEKLVEQVLTDSDDWNNPNEALKFLVDAGLQERNKLDGIEKIAAKAMANKRR